MSRYRSSRGRASSFCRKRHQLLSKEASDFVCTLNCPRLRGMHKCPDLSCDPLCAVYFSLGARGQIICRRVRLADRWRSWARESATSRHSQHDQGSEQRQKGCEPRNADAILASAPRQTISRSTQLVLKEEAHERNEKVVAIERRQNLQTPRRKCLMPARVTLAICSLHSADERR